MRTPLMPKATAIWFIDNTALDFTQIADFTGLHTIEVQALADEEVGRGIVGRDPVKNNELAQEELDKAIADLTFSKRRIANDVLKCLQSAIANAENNHGLDVDELVVAEAWCGKNLTLKRGRPRARGRFGKIMKPFSEITIKVRQVGESA